MIKLLIPDLPTAEQISPWLSTIDQQCWYTNLGPLVVQLESQVRGLLPGSTDDGPKLLAVGSGTLALDLALRLLELPRGARVLLPSFNFPAAAHVARNAGLTPVFTDVDSRQWVMTPEIAYAVMGQTSIDAVVPVATFGQPLSAEAWDSFAVSTGVPVVIDAAAALGQQAVGEHTTVTFSLHATKPFGIGEGGLLASADESIIERARRASNFGFASKQVVDFGMNAKMSEYHAAVGLAQCDRWSDIQSARLRIWQSYAERLAQIPGIALQTHLLDRPPAVLQIELPTQAAAVARHLADLGIETRQWYCPTLHQHPLFSNVECIGTDGSSRLAVAERLTSVSLGLPFHTRLKPEDIVQVCNSLAVALEDLRQPRLQPIRC